MRRRIWFWGLSMLRWGSAQAQVVKDRAVVDSADVVTVSADTAGGYSRATDYAAQQQWERSNEVYRSALERDSTLLLAWMGLAENACATGQYAHGLSLLSPLDGLAGDNTSFYLLRAIIAMYLNYFDQALDDAIVALHLGDVEGFSAIYAIGNLDNNLALRKTEAASLRYPTEFMWPYCMGLLHMVEYRYQEAIQFLSKANELCPLSSINEQRAKCYEVLGLFADGVTAIDEAIRLNPENRVYYKKRMQLLAFSGKIDEAIWQGERYLNVQPDDVESYNFIGYLCYWKRDWDKAASYVGMGIELDRAFAPMYVLRGMILQAKGELTAARQDFETALEKYEAGGTIASSYHAYAGLGRIEEGAEALERYLSTESNEGTSYYDGACFYARAGQPDKAIEYLEMAARKGFCQCAMLIHDPDLDCIRNEARFKELLKQREITYHYQE